MTTNSNILVEEIADDLNTYLKRGLPFDSFSESIDPNLSINNIEKLLRIHFVLTGDGGDFGVINFVKKLPSRIRRLKTTVSKKTEIFEGEIRGNIDWQKTIKERCRSNYADKTRFACNETKKNYNIDENLVLKKLLSIIHQIVFEDLKPALDNEEEYVWLKNWVGEGNLRKVLENVFLRNIYIRRISFEGSVITKRTVNNVKKSRDRLYREAARLLEKYRRLMDHEIEKGEAKDLLRNTFIKPENTDTLFELYWIIRILNNYDAVRFHLIEGSNNQVAEWEDKKFEYKIYHNSTGSSGFLSFQEKIEDMNRPSEDGYLAREARVAENWREISKEAFDFSGKDSLWGGRPDIIVEKYEKDLENLVQLFIGEVKHTENREYAAQGLKELLEYMALVKKDKKYISDLENVFQTTKIKGMLFVDQVGEVQELESENISIKKYGEKIENIL